MKNRVVFSSVKHDWQTPDSVLDLVEQFRHIRLDPCTTLDNPVGAEEFFTPADDGLSKDWQMERGGLIYVNPPYGRELKKWVGKVVSETSRRPFQSNRLGTEVILLIPARPDTANWQQGIFNNADAVCFVQGRIKFRGAHSGAPFPSALVYFGDREEDFCKHFRSMGHCFEVLPHSQE